MQTLEGWISRSRRSRYSGHRCQCVCVVYTSAVRHAIIVHGQCAMFTDDETSIQYLKIGMYL